MNISFHGAAQEVTGSCCLLQTEKTNLLIDCGMFQGGAEHEQKNFMEFGFDPASVQTLLVSHAHLDHIGRIPLLVKRGFSGTIFSTAATRDLSRLILEDALGLAQREGRELFSAEDLEAAFRIWHAVPYYEKNTAEDVEFRFGRSGHILGSCLIEIWAEKKHLLFTGDLGNIPSVLLPPPDTIEGIEYLITESTYGSRTHESAQERQLELERAIEDVGSRAGVLMIPAFAAERTQEILHLINEMMHFKRIPDMPVFVDAPLAIRITEVYERYPDEYHEDIRALMAAHPNLFKFKRLRLTESVEDSKAINDVPMPKVVIAGSGMMTGGRILHHARRYLPDEKSILLIIGYQGAGSLGRRLIDGASVVRMFGEDVPVRAEVRKIGGFSAHADGPQLFSFADRMRDTLKRVFVVHGEPAEAMFLAQEIRDRMGIPADVPVLHEEVKI
ncbi:MAG: MBL fold metallo-hydrolase [Candidatus Sungbacteria bacterium]|nr:MBL fold metallo-hydrolase [Candidatus Sungbacteria bacterium]